MLLNSLLTVGKYLQNAHQPRHSLDQRAQWEEYAPYTEPRHALRHALNLIAEGWSVQVDLKCLVPTPMTESYGQIAVNDITRIIITTIGLQKRTHYELSICKECPPIKCKHDK